MLPADNDWSEYKRLILAHMERSTLDHMETKKGLSEIKVQLATLKARASVWGAISGAVLAALLHALVK
jgi:hypothetical protein